MYQRQGDFLVKIPLNLSEDPSETLPLITNNIKFSVSSSDENINYFENNALLPDTFRILINSATSNQKLDSITYAMNDVINIEVAGTYFPFWKPPTNETTIVNNTRVSAKIRMLMGNLPTMFNGTDEVTDFSHLFYMQDFYDVPEKLFSQNVNVTTFEGCFSFCARLMGIPSKLFSDTLKVTSFKNCFMCTNIESISEGLFNKCTEVTDFSGCFAGSVVDGDVVPMHIASIPQDIFKYNTKVTDFSRCFQYNEVAESDNAEFSLIIGSPNVTKCEDFCPDTMNVTLYVPADSNTFNSFTALGKSNITINTFTDIDDVTL